MRVLSLILLVLAGLVLTACGDTRPALTFSPDALPAARVGQPYTATITVSGNVTPVGGAGVEPGSLPPGLVLQHRNEDDQIEITGTPEASGTFTFTIDVWCYGTNQSGQTGERSYTLVVE
ncbi:MAG TPA: Ig domain-containing protein [Herpetosiphonaceae bacterium]